MEMKGLSLELNYIFMGHKCSFKFTSYSQITNENICFDYLFCCFAQLSVVVINKMIASYL